MKLEFQILGLFLLSVGALLFHHLCPRTLEVDFRDAENWELHAGFAGPGTSASYEITERGAEVEMDIMRTEAFTFSSAAFEPTELIELGWFSEVAFTAWIEGKESECFRLYVRNVIPEIYEEGNEHSLQFNEVMVKLTSNPREYTYKADQFNVPSWWVESHPDHFEILSPNFNGVKRVELVTGSAIDTSKFTVVIEKMVFRGHWILPMVLYRTLLAAWMVLATGVALQKLLDIKAALKLSTARESHLEMVNRSLETKANELTRLAHHDPLTGLLNRLGILQYTRLAEDAVRRGDKVSLVLLDVDDFKQINDSFGHNHGDELLAALAALLGEQSVGVDLFARWGGEEFIAICFGKDETAAKEFARNVGIEIENELGATCSIGIYEMDRRDDSFLDSVNRADHAMYQAKRQGKNRAVMWSELGPEQQVFELEALESATS